MKQIMSRTRHWLQQESSHFAGAYKQWQEDDASLMAASVAYYLGLSFFPLLLVLIAGLGLFFSYSDLGRDAEGEVLRTISSQFSPAVAELAEQALANVKDKSTWTGPVGLLGILLAAIAGFAQFDNAFDRIWNVPRPTEGGILIGLRRVFLQRGVAFLMLLGMATLVIAVLLTAMVLSGFETHTEGLLPYTEWVVKLVRTLATFALNLLLFTLLYRWLPEPDVGWREAFRGGVVVAIAWEIGRLLLASILIGSKYSSAYGVIGSFIAIQLWCYYAMAILFFGAEYIQEFCRACQAAEARSSRDREQSAPQQDSR